MKRVALLLAGVALQAGVANAASFDSRGVARFDVGYARCEAKFAPMKGHRDEAYLAVYRVKPDEKSLARLAALAPHARVPEGAQGGAGRQGARGGGRQPAGPAVPGAVGRDAALNAPR